MLICILSCEKPEQNQEPSYGYTVNHNRDTNIKSDTMFIHSVK